MTTWTTQLTTIEACAGEHDRYGQNLLIQVVKSLETARASFEDLRKSHTDYQLRLVRERDVTYSDLKKTKAKYDGICQEVENRRKKLDSSHDASRLKANAGYQSQLGEMNNQKNSYLISVSVTNKLKEKYYHEYVPDLLDSLQDLSETRVAKLNAMWSLAADLEKKCHLGSGQHIDHLRAEINRNDPSLDSTMFARHNAVAYWNDPPDMRFEPSPVWLDNDSLAVDESAKNYLRNLLTKSKPMAREKRIEMERIERELEGIRRQRQNARQGVEKRDEIDVVRSEFNLMEDKHAAEKKRLAAEIEVSKITATVGDLTLGAQSHAFKAETFKIPTNCDLCGDRIWGLSAKGQICKDCGFTCHSKCEMKVPADCPGEQSKEDRKRLKAERQETARSAPVVESASQNQPGYPGLARQDTMHSLSSGYATTAQRSVSSSSLARPQPENIDTLSMPGNNAADATEGTQSVSARRPRIVAPPPTTYMAAEPPSTSSSGTPSARGKMLYSYEARDEGELSVTEGSEVSIVEPDGKFGTTNLCSGSKNVNDLTTEGGWTKVKTPSGMSGLVPTAYFEELPPSTTPKSAITPDRPTSAYSNHSTTSSNIAKKKGPAVAPRRGAKKIKHCEALYDYNAQSQDEFDMQEGDRFELISMGIGDGWAEVAKNGETRCVPANYIQEV